jgi:hypothetical protein
LPKNPGFSSENIARDEKLLLRILSGLADANIDFDELRKLLTGFGFEERTRGSYHMFRRDGVVELLNL